MQENEDIVARHPLDKAILVGALRPILVEALREFFGRSDLSGPHGQSFIETCEKIAAEAPEATTIATLRAEVDKLRAELKLCGKDNCMGRRVKGVTQWVTEQAKDAAVAAVRAEVEGLRSAFAAACAFIDCHAADPDLTEKMVQTYAEFQKRRAAIDAAKADKEGA